MPKQISAFDQWLHRDLRDQYAAVLKEPVPEELLRLLVSAGMRD